MDHESAIKYYQYYYFKTVISTTVIVAQSRTSNHSVFKTKCYTIENNGKKLSEKHSKTNKGGFSLP